MTDLDKYTVQLTALRQVRALYEDGHYLHRARVGRQLNYAILRGTQLAGAICYALPMMRTGYLGLNSNALLEFARLYLLENEKGVAVWAIAQTLRRVRTDWLTAFPGAQMPRIVVSWHDTARHLGTIYKAANFTYYKLTKPRKRGPLRYGASFSGVRDYTSDDAHIKGTWLYPLDRNARRLIMANAGDKSGIPAPVATTIPPATVAL